MRKYYIDYLRVIAIFGVITIHVTNHFYSKMDAIDKLSWWLYNILNSASRFSVPVFVMIYGAVLLGRTISTRQFYRKRLVRLLPAITFWTIFYIGFNVYNGMDTSGLMWFLKVGLFANGCAAIHLWYLSMFVCLMMFAPFINTFINGDKPSSTDLVVLLSVIFLFFILNGISNVAREVRSINIEWFKVFPWYIAYFINGYYLDKYVEKINIKNAVILLFITVLICVGAVLNYYTVFSLKIVKDYFILGDTSPLLFIIASLVFIFAKINAIYLRENKIICAISEASFGMYLIHPVFVYILQNNLPFYDSMPLTYIPITITLTGLVSCLSIIFIRKNTFMRAVC